MLPPMAEAGKPGALIALRDRREEVIALLTEQFSRDAFDVEELERRLDLAHRASDIVALDALVADLVPAGDGDDAAAAPTTALATRAEPSAAELDAWPARRRLFAIFGGFEKKGAWTCPRRLWVVTVCGGATLDFRQADLAPGVSELRITTVMGGVEIIVPPHLAVECDASAILGGFEHIERAPRTPDPGRPVLRITGLAIMGGASIETRLPGESARDARRRARKERRALRGRARAELPPARVHQDD